MGGLQEERLQVILKIKKGRGFSLMTKPLVIVAALDGTKLETNKVLPIDAANINTELTWEVDKKYLQRLRKINTAFKIECFFDVNNKKREKLGYICLNLKQAQIVDLTNNETEIQIWHNFLGVPRNIKCKPEILLVFKIQEATDLQEAVKNVAPTPNKLMPLGVMTMEQNRKSSYLQIGPSKLCTRFYELAVEITESGNLCSIISPNAIGTPLKIQFHIMGILMLTKEFYGFKGILNKEKFKVQIKSEIEFLAAYFKQFPTLTLYLLCGEKLIGSGILNLQELTDLREHFTATTKERIVLKATDGRDNHVTYCLSPFLNVEVALVPMLSKKESDTVLTKCNQFSTSPSIVITQPSIQSSETSNTSSLIDKNQIINSPKGKIKSDPTADEEAIISCGIIPEIQLPNGPGKLVENSSSELAMEYSPEEHSQDVLLSDSEKLIKRIDTSSEAEFLPNEIGANAPVDSKHNVEIQCNYEPTVQPDTSATATIAQAPILKMDGECEGALPKVFVQELAKKYIEELEDWKDKQQEIFKLELKRKSEKHLNKLSNEWLKRQETLENDLSIRLQNCHILKDRLEEVLLELEYKIEHLNKLENELHFGKNELDKKYTLKFRELRRASRQHQQEVEEKIKQSDLIKTELKNKVSDLEAETARLKQILATESQARLPIEESKKLMEEKEALKKKLEKAVESKNYFKEQCSLAIRQLHKMKEEVEDREKWKMKKQKDGTEIIGLVEEINNEVDEMRKDQSTLKALRNDIIKCGQFH